jgi:tetratricopeptide (TPR) repeat protein
MNRQRAWLVGLALVIAWGVPHAVVAQGASGKAEGVVKDAKGEPVDGATVGLQPASGKKVETKTNKQGQYSVGVAPGDYAIQATKGTLISVPVGARIAAGATATTAIVLLERKDIGAATAAAAATAKADAAKVADFKTAFDAGAAAAGAGRHDEAIEKFTQAAGFNSKCSDCYSGIGSSYLQKKDYGKAEAAFLKSNEITPNEGSYTGLAQVYTAQKKQDQASAAIKKAAELGAASGPAGGGASADSLFNQGVILWNGGKIEEAKKQFQAAVEANPNHAEAHYQLGMALVNEGNLAGAATEWDTYLKLSPSGPHAGEVKAMLPALKK